MGVCACFCCIGRPCEGKLVGNFPSGPSDCTTPKCTEVYPTSCPRNETIGGQIRASYDAGSTGGSTGSRGPTFDQQPSNGLSTGAIVGIVIAAVILIACCVAVFMRNKKQKESYNPSAGNQPLPYGQQPYDPRYPPYQQQYGQPYGQQQSGMNPMAAGALGVGAGLIGGAVLSNAFHHHHHHDHYGGYNNGYSGGNDFSGGGDFTSVDNF
ncbi:hypothetical protein EDD86DRAFT_92804 [Gorgonomyces haynaldii]|nr:hypothetical protein EDD86DRAFT_92804 [Gorgonomyces haynaldii]